MRVFERASRLWEQEAYTGHEANIILRHLLRSAHAMRSNGPIDRTTATRDPRRTLSTLHVEASVACGRITSRGVQHSPFEPDSGPINHPPGAGRARERRRGNRVGKPRGERYLHAQRGEI